MATDWIARSQRLNLRVRDLVDGRWQEQHGKTIGKCSPRDGQQLYEFAGGDAHSAASAVASAQSAHLDARWAGATLQHRKDVLHRLASLIEANREEFALLESLDVGKPISESLSFDVPAAAATIRFCAEAVDKVYGTVYGVDESSLSYQLKRPCGVVAGIIGWNFPLLLAATKIGPALATGNCLVLKPSEITSLSAVRVAELALEAGVPPGVLNVVHGGAEVGAALSVDPNVKVISFTGGTHTGKQLLIAAGQSNMKRLVLECGGKAPNIAFDDAPDLEQIATVIATRAFWNQGQVCTASSRLLIQEGIKDRLLELIIEKIATLTPGDPLDPASRFGAVVSQAHRQRILGYIKTGEEQGARLVFQGTRSSPVEGGFYVPPVVFDRVCASQRIAQEEIFGPVLSVIVFRDERDAIDIANSTSYGLSAMLWTRDVGRAHRVSYGLDAGWIVVNATAQPKGGPSTGVLSVGGHKESGFGAEGGLEGFDHYTVKSAVQIFV